MAVTEKFYPDTTEFLLNAIYDIQEMRKAKAIKRPGKEPDIAEVELVTDMYAVKKTYLFRLTRSESGTMVKIEADDGAENAEQSVRFMLNILDGMIEPFRGVNQTDDAKTGIP